MVMTYLFESKVLGEFTLRAVKTVMLSSCQRHKAYPFHKVFFNKINEIRCVF